jgi:HSP20 family protein
MATTTPVKGQEAVPAPFEPATPFWLTRMRDEFARLCDCLCRTSPRGTEGNGGWRWGLDMEEKDDAIVVRAEAPGFAPEEIEVEAADARLVVHAKKKEEKAGKEGVKEWRQAECYEAIALPANINKDKVEAKYSNGVLTITLPKAEKARGRKVPVTPA